MAKKKKILYPVIFMILVTAAFTFLLAFINDITSEAIAEQEKLEVQQSILYSLNVPVNNMTEREIINYYNDNINERTINDKVIYELKVDDEIQGYAFKFVGEGLWGSITGHIAFDSNFKLLKGVNFTAHSETPGLGGRIDEIEFKEQFRNIEITNDDEIIEYGTATGGNVDAITGATSTSTAVKNIFNNEIPKLVDLAKKEGIHEGN